MVPGGRGGVTYLRWALAARAPSGRARSAGTVENTSARQARIPRRQQLYVAHAGTLGEHEPVDSTVTRTGRVARPTLHSTPSASARARV